MSEKKFLAVLLTNSTVRATWWAVADGQLARHELSDIQAYTDRKSCIVATDKSLQNLGKESEHINEVLFGLEPSWTDAQGIVDERKSWLKELTKELSLHPVGFVVCPEAVAQAWMERQPTESFVLVYLTANDVLVSLVAVGKLLATVTVGRSAAVAADLKEALARIQTNAAAAPTHWPTKFLVMSMEVSPGELDDIKQQLQQVDWPGKAFIQPPVITTISVGEIVAAVVQQGGKAVALDQDIPLEQTAHPAVTAPPMAMESPTGSDFGFQEVEPVAVQGEALFDGSPDANVVVPADDNEKAIIEEPSAGGKQLPKAFGIPIPWERVIQGRAVPTPEPNPMTTPDTMVMPTKHKHGKKSWWHKHVKLALIGFVAGLVTLLGITWFALATQTQATVTVTLKAKPVTTTTTLTVDPKLEQSDLTTQALAGQILKKTLTGKKTVTASGVKLVGDKAKGTVVLANKTDASKTFAAGTKLAAGTLVFILDKEVTVPGASVSSQSSQGETRTYGRSEATITADKIGPEGNLSKDAALKVGDFADSSYAAVTKEALAGGSSREVQVVAEKDRETVLTNLKQELAAQAISAFSSEAPPDQRVLPTGNITVKKAEYSAKVGDEVNELVLQLEAEAAAVSYRIADIEPLARTILQGNVPANHQLVAQAPEILTSPAPMASSSAKLQLTANLSSRAVPKVESNQWAEKMKGKSITQAQQLLQQQPEVEKVVITQQPSFIRFFWKNLPSQAQRITIVTE